MAIRYAHTNLVARDWRKLAAFCEELFNCLPVLPERDLSGEWLERASGVVGAHIRGIHLRLPGLVPDGPTLEISIRHTVDAKAPTANRLGFGHIAFQVGDVEGVKRQVLNAGGSAVGSVETVEIAGVGRLPWTYVRDPEGNIIELQRREQHIE